MGKIHQLAGKSKATVGLIAKYYDPRTMREKGLIWTSSVVLTTVVLVILLLWFYWDFEPKAFDVRENAIEMAGGDESKLVPGFVTASTVVRIADVLLSKRGGYLSNDKLPPGVLMDNMPNWEFGVLVQVRDISQSLRNDLSRSQTQSREDKDLIIADPQFHFNSDSWFLPATEGEYRDGIDALESYRDRLADNNAADAQFFTRADNLAAYLSYVEKRLGSLSQRLGASVAENRINVDLAGDPNATQSTPTAAHQTVRTPWMSIDDEFYEARGYAWALIEVLKALEIDFKPVLEKKNAIVSLRQIINELEHTQNTVWSPAILNGTGFALLANHSLVMASYISRANAGIIDLRDLLKNG